MGVPTELVTALLEGDSVEERREAASELAERSTGSPAALTPVLDRIVGALHDPDDRVRTAAARVCFEVGTHDAGTVEPLLQELLGSLDDPVPAVRANVARPVAEVVVRDPAAGRVAAGPLRDRLDDRSEGVRHSAAWALEWLATRHPEVVPGERLTALLEDTHPPVRKHAARTCALRPVPDERRHEHLVDLLSDESIPVRRAACLALGASARADNQRLLAQVARTDLNDDVRLAARRALRESTYARAVPVPESTADTGALAAILVTGDRAVGNWIRVDVPDVTPRGGRFRGVVETVDPLKGTIALENEPVGYRLELRRTPDGWVGSYEGTERTGSLSVQPSGAERLDDDRTPVHYAVEGDRLAFTVEGTPHSIEVTEHDTETGRVRGENWMQGYAVEFRPATAGPLRALFERGRAFEATDLELIDSEAEEQAESETV
jgi:hypothetical protein